MARCKPYTKKNSKVHISVELDVGEIFLNMINMINIIMKKVQNLHNGTQMLNSIVVMKLLQKKSHQINQEIKKYIK